MTNKEANLFSEVDAIIGQYRTRSIEIMPGLTYSMYNTLKKAEFYYNSKYLGGNLDNLGREKPFYNINKFRVNVATRATDLDVKDVTVTADNPKSVTKAFILNHELYEWMKESDFSSFLNEMGSTRAKYGGVLVKKCVEEEDGEEELKVEVCQWKNMVTDQIDIDCGTKIERHWLEPKDLWEKEGIWSNIPEAVQLASKIRQNVTNNGVNTLGSDKKVQILEVEGYFPDSQNPEAEGDADNKYRLMHFIYATNNNDNVYLYGEEIEESVYKYLDYDKVQGRGLGVGVIEDGFEAQVWTNDAIISQKNAMDLAGKVVLKTNSKKVGNNVLTDLDNGRIIQLEDGKDITPINLNPTALPVYQTLIDQWNTQFERVSSTFNAITGEAMPSGTPYRQTAILNQEAGSLFEYRKQEAGIFVAEIINDWVLPYLIEKIKAEHILSSDFSDEELRKIDEDFATNYANEIAIEKVLNGEVLTQEQYDSIIQEGKNTLSSTFGKKRYLEIPKNYFKDFEGKVSVNITGELKNKGAILESLNNILMTIAKVPQVLTDPNLKNIFSQIMEVSGAQSPVSLTTSAPTTGQTPMPGMDMSQLQNSVPAAGTVE